MNSLYVYKNTISHYRRYMVYSVQKDHFDREARISR